ncbi:MAG: NAD(P)/FAD-dependent oxidoreductase [Myxococcales bacterium]|nr:NAD(P)/FAD-dependent oxidoreductase [Myxococcales bacterium]
MQPVDVVVIGSGPNGLAAALRLASAGVSVRVLEAAATPGGGMRSAQLTLDGFVHDVCSACHPMGVLSPYLRTLPLADHGLRWVFPEISVAHPLPGRPAALLGGTVDATAAGLGVDGAAYRSLLDPLVRDGEALFEGALAPLGLPRSPLVMARFGTVAWRSAVGLARRFRDDPARALVAGCAAHATQPLENPLTAAMALVFLVAAHRSPWPVVEGGTGQLARAMVRLLEARGGEVLCGQRVTDLRDLPPCRAVLFDTSPDQLASLGGPWLPERYTAALRRFRYGPGAFKLDWALDGPIPWADPSVGRAVTVHLGGTLESIAAHERAVFAGRHTDDPYVLLVQQSAVDPTRAPAGKHTGYAYIHVPHGSTRDATDLIEAQVERAAPGFRDLILARHVTTPADFHAYDANYVGGAVTGGVADAAQLFTRPVARLDPYSTPSPRLFIGSASTPPGGGVHGMCGYHAAGSILGRLGSLDARSPSAWGSP